MTESKYPIDPLEFDDVSTYPIADRKSKVHTGLFGKPSEASDTVGDFLDKLPGILGASDLRDLVDALTLARTEGRPLLWGMGGHVIKCGLGPILIDLMRDRFVTGVLMNGSSMIHDFEIALHGSTSEEVESEIKTGRFGMARETGEYLNQAINDGAGLGLGMGESVGRFLDRSDHGIDFKHLDSSVLYEAYRQAIPTTVHVAIGTDITHIHPSASGKNIGQTSMHDLKLLTAMMCELEGGVYVNVGSAVILPEVFLKALSVARNLGHTIDKITTANLDFIQHYRPRENVLKRPTQRGGRAIALTGHHEIMVPLIAAALKQKAEGTKPEPA
jgi:deoxyhypusine synthase